MTWTSPINGGDGTNRPSNGQISKKLFFVNVSSNIAFLVPTTCYANIFSDMCFNVRVNADTHICLNACVNVFSNFSKCLNTFGVSIFLAKFLYQILGRKFCNPLSKFKKIMLQKMSDIHFLK